MPPPTKKLKVFLYVSVELDQDQHLGVGIWITVPTRIVDAATILGFGLFGAATIQTESTIQ